MARKPIFLREQKGSLKDLFRRVRGRLVSAVAFQTVVSGSNLAETSFLFLFFLSAHFIIFRCPRKWEFVEVRSFCFADFFRFFMIKCEKRKERKRCWWMKTISFFRVQFLVAPMRFGKGRGGQLFFRCWGSVQTPLGLRPRHRSGFAARM